MSSPSKVLFIGIDSGEPDLILKWSEEGLLPTFRALQNQSAWGGAQTPPGLGNGAMWPSLFTGVNPAKHGRYFENYLQPGTYELTKFHQDVNYKRPPFWKIVSDAGRRVAIIDMVLGPLTKDLNGMQLVDWLSHDREPPVRSWPPELAEEAIARWGEDEIYDIFHKRDRDTEGFREFHRLLRERIKTKTEASLHYMQQEDWDLFMTVFAAPHDIGHVGWQLHDPNHPKYDAEVTRALGEPLRDIYIAIDAAVGELVAQAGPDTTVIVFTGPGMEPCYTGNPMMNQVLRRLEGLPDEDPMQSRPKQHKGQRMYKKVMPAALRKLLREAGITPTFRKALYQSKEASKRQDLSCFALPHPFSGCAIRVNVAGREPNGKIQPGAAYDAFCDALTADLMGLVNLDTGKPAVRNIVRIAEVYDGEALDMLPDLLVEWSRDAPITGMSSPKVGEVYGTPELLDYFTGDHNPHTLFYAMGPTIQPGQIKAPFKVEDLAPTMSAMMGVSLPDVDGKPIDELFSAVPA